MPGTATGHQGEQLAGGLCGLDAGAMAVSHGSWSVAAGRASPSAGWLLEPVGVALPIASSAAGSVTG